uniref:Uncharacterized protein n=1 Tax=Faecalibaculum rodentium TaxID=1702221 RepID=A0A140DT34_9FIRM|nr:hypothetical protein AALO17_06770 [Faecalibaculum rodentium]
MPFPSPGRKKKPAIRHKNHQTQGSTRFRVLPFLCACSRRMRCSHRLRAIE